MNTGKNAFCVASLVRSCALDFLSARQLLAVALFSALLGANATAQTRTPIPDLGSGTYLGAQGGLYPGGSNSVPAAHAAAALVEAQQIVPRDASGAPAEAGIIGMVCLGMSNSSQEFEDLERALDADTARNAKLVIANTCAGGQAAESMDEASDLYWSSIAPQRLAATGIDPDQVQVGWLKQAFLMPPTTIFPDHALALRDSLAALVRVARTRYPNLRLLYLSSRIYGGYAGSGNTGEPMSYQSGFGAKWLIEQQIDGAAALNYNAANGPVVAPLLLWGPYLWANGSTPNGSGTAWLTSDFEADNIHPSPAGEAKVGALLIAYFANEPSATWLRARGDARLSVIGASADAYVDTALPNQNFGSDTQLLLQAGAGLKRVWMRFNVAEPIGDLLHAKLVVRDVNSGLSPAVALASNTAWNETGLTFNNAPPIDGATLSTGSGWTRENCPSFGATAALAADADGVLSFVISTPAMTQQRIYSRETALGPLLILSLRTPDLIFAHGFE